MNLGARKFTRLICSQSITSGTTAHPKGVMITHRNAWMNSTGTLLYVPMTCADRYLWTLPMFHANGWTVWTVTPRERPHLSAQSRTARRLRIDGERAGDNAVRSANSFDFTGERAGALHHLAPKEFALSRPARRPHFHHPATEEEFADDHPCLRTDRDSAVHHRAATGGTCALPTGNGPRSKRARVWS
jgi:hypothetical protein